MGGLLEPWWGSYASGAPPLVSFSGLSFVRLWFVAVSFACLCLRTL
jgi:hypothetical protein